MRVLFLAPILFAYTGWLGSRLLAECPLPPWEKRWLGPVVGFVALLLSASALCFLGLLYPACIYGCLVLLGVLSIGLQKLRFVRRSGEAESQESDSGAGVPIVLRFFTLSICGIVGVHTLLCALTPEVRSDPVRYHISMANQYAVRGGIEPLRETVWWSVPQYGECLYALGIALCNDTLSKLFHWWAGVLSTLGVFALATRWFGKAAAYWAVLLWVTTPMVSYEATTTYVELILTLWILVSVWSGGRALVAEDLKPGGAWLGLSGFALGLAFGTKYTALAVQGLAWILFPCLFLIRQRKKPGAWAATLLSFGFIGLGDFPWLLRNGILTGNPLYPLFNNLLGLREGVDLGAELYFRSISPAAALVDPLYYWEKFVRLFHSGYNYPGVATVVLFCLIAIRGKRLSKSLFTKSDFWRIELAFCSISFLGHVFLTTNMDGRFWLPTLAVFLPFLGEGLTRIFKEVDRRFGSPAFANVLVLMVILFCAYNYVGQRAVFFRNFQESPLPILSDEARWDYYARKERGDPKGRVLEKLIPQGAVVFGLRYPERVHSVFSDQERVPHSGKVYRSNFVPLLDPFVESDRSPESFLEAAAAAGVEYLVLPEKRTPDSEEFWQVAEQVGIPVEGGEGRLYRIPNLDSSLKPELKGEN